MVVRSCAPHCSFITFTRENHRRVTDRNLPENRIDGCVRVGAQFLEVTKNALKCPDVVDEEISVPRKAIGVVIEEKNL